MAPEIKIGERLVGKFHKPLVIVELGINHGGSLRVAKKMVRSARKQGAEVIKHQTHIPDAEMSVEALNVIPGNSSKSIYEVIQDNSLTLEEEEELYRYVIDQGMIYISTPFSFAAADFLFELGVPAFKIGSGECSNFPLVQHIAKYNKPIILSTGMNAIKDIRTSVQILRDAKIPFALLQCTNLYPTPLSLLNVHVVKEYQEIFPDAVVGLSDHSTTIFPAIASVALGSSIIEKHFTDTHRRKGPDIPCSMDPKQLQGLLNGVENVFHSLGGGKQILPEEEITRKFAFASVVSTKFLTPGHVITAECITMKRPGGGDFGPSDFDKIIGRRVTAPINQNTQIKRDQID